MIVNKYTGSRKCLLEAVLLLRTTFFLKKDIPVVPTENAYA